MKHTIWIAYTDKEIFATWYKECVQSFKSWRNAVLSLRPDCKIVYRSVDL